MQAQSVANKNRHFKTLILLVVSMTVGAFFLFWLGQMTPVTPLSARAKSAAPFKEIAVRTGMAETRDKSFFHLRIDEEGRLFQTTAWKAKAHDPRRLGTIQIVLTVSEQDEGISAAQQKCLARLLADLRKDFAIASSNIRLDKMPTLASHEDSDAPTSIGL
ncbi:MAG: N-acetylmuramoyl-L-alanine amidase [Planctomycetes bacterium]|nr:N-acetylmuramoyl-L-alanine amidase [Planctomycetota bacterium]